MKYLSSNLLISLRQLIVELNKIQFITTSSCKKKLSFEWGQTIFNLVTIEFLSIVRFPKTSTSTGLRIYSMSASTYHTTTLILSSTIFLQKPITHKKNNIWIGNIDVREIRWEINQPLTEGKLYWGLVPIHNLSFLSLLI